MTRTYERHSEAKRYRKMSDCVEKQLHLGKMKKEHSQHHYKKTKVSDRSFKRAESHLLSFLLLVESPLVSSGRFLSFMVVVRSKSRV